MKELKILVPRIKPPEYHDIVTDELNNIFLKLKQDFKIKIYWIIFQPYEFKQYSINESQIIDYHKYDDAVDIIDEFEPDLIITEVLLGINGIAFATAGKFRNIPVVTISNPGTSGKISKIFQLKMMIRLLFSRKVLADVSNTEQKFGFFRWAFHRYSFLVATLKKCDKNFLELIKFFYVYPRIQIFSNTYLVMHPILSGDLNICFNRHYYERLLNSNFDQNTLIITGDPAYDHIFDEISSISPLTKTSEKIHVLLCLSAMHEHGWLSKDEDDEIVLNILKTVLKNKQFEIALKIHPSSSSFHEYELLLKQIGDDVKLYQKENTIKLMNDYDVMINYGSSNVVLDVILNGKPVVMYIFNQNEEFNRYFDPKVISGCKTLSELPQLITNAITKEIKEKDFQNYVENFIGKYDGKSAERIVYHIKLLLKKYYSNVQE